ncbi:MAG: M48 family metallopeptidase [Acidiferrobacterales bacterium]
MRSFFHSPPEHDELVVNGITLRYQLRRSARRATLCVQIFGDGGIRVAAPFHARRAQIHAFLAGRIDWIRTKRGALLEIARHRRVIAIAEGSELPVLDEKLVLRQQLAPGIRPAAYRQGCELIVSAPAPEDVPALVLGWYRSAARRHASARVQHYSPVVGRAPARLSIRGQKTRWGSCSARGTVSLNWRLMQAAPEIFDYVVVHELCHLLHPNHSLRFWGEVGRVLPDYQRLRQELRTFGLCLAL